MFDIIIDTREQLPLEFSSSMVKSVRTEKLDTGDYTIAGLENVLFIERKGSLTEFYRNCTQDRFWKELDRTAPFKYKFLVLECAFEDIAAIPYSLGLPKSQWAQLKVKPQYIVKCVGDIQVKYGIHVIFAGNRENATEMILNIMKRVSENESQS
jgi:ERCC4-type nuclease